MVWGGDIVLFVHEVMGLAVLGGTGGCNYPVVGIDTWLQVYGGIEI